MRTQPRGRSSRILRRSSARRAALAACALAVLVLSGCAPEPGPAKAKGAPHPLFGSEEEAFAAAEVAYEDYQAMSDRVSSDGGQSAERLRDYAVGDLLEDELEGFEEFASSGYASTGNVSIADFRSFAITLRETPAVRALVCLDVSATNVFDSTGTSVLPIDRVPRRLFLVSFAQSGYALLPSERQPWEEDGTCE